MLAALSLAASKCLEHCRILARNASESGWRYLNMKNTYCNHKEDEDIWLNSFENMKIIFTLKQLQWGHLGMIHDDSYHSSDVTLRSWSNSSGFYASKMARKLYFKARITRQIKRPHAQDAGKPFQLGEILTLMNINHIYTTPQKGCLQIGCNKLR